MTVALVGLGALAAACVQATIGMGFALVLTPVAFALLSPAAAIVAVTALGLELNLLVLLAERRHPRIAWREVVPILLAAAPGTVCGVLVLGALPKPALQIVVGVALIAAATLLLCGPARAAGRRPRPPGARLAVGFTTGVLSTATGVSGPPVALWLARERLEPGEVRDTLSALFLAVGLVGLASLAPMFGRTHLGAGLLGAGLACVAAGHALGSRAFARLEASRFRPLLLAVITLAGVASVAAGAGGL
jgi:uncharacterized membrane protein YfcA